MEDFVILSLSFLKIPDSLDFLFLLRDSEPISQQVLRMLLYLFLKFLHFHDDLIILRFSDCELHIRYFQVHFGYIYVCRLTLGS